MPLVQELLFQHIAGKHLSHQLGDENSDVGSSLFQHQMDGSTIGGTNHSFHLNIGQETVS